MPIEKITYTLSKEDYLEHLLYASSKTPSIQNKRKVYKILLPVVYIIIGAIGLISGNMVLFSSLIALAILWWVLFPKFERNLYTKRFSKYIDQQLKSNAYKSIELEIHPEQIFQKEENITYTIAFEQINIIHEIKNYIYIGLKDGYTIIIPKNKIQHLDQWKQIFLENIQAFEIPQVIDLNWKWE